MKNVVRYGLPLLVVIAIGAYWYDINSESEVSPTRTLLDHMGDECELIAEKAALKLPEALPFQKMEKIARKLRVLETCMNDRGFVENPAWVKYAQPIAQKVAAQSKISENEAYETFRRQKMIEFSSAKEGPMYWIPAKSQANN
ncbi:MAG TPA: hypothetical protein DCO68_09155 [Methylophilaceae bacterium]|nr:hypothetical protein [Methylophilaceae bacterium]